MNDLYDMQACFNEVSMALDTLNVAFDCIIEERCGTAASRKEVDNFLRRLPMFMSAIQLAQNTISTNLDMCESALEHHMQEIYDGKVVLA